MNDKDPDSQLIAEIEKRIEEGTEFEGLIPVHARKPRNPRAVFSVRLSPEELAVIAKGASLKDQSVSDFIRDVAITAAELQLAASDPEGVGLVDIARSLDALRDRVEAALKENARTHAAS